MITFALPLDPTIVQLGQFQLSWHGVFTSLAIVVAVWIGLGAMQRVAERRGFSPAPLDGVALWAVAGGVIGARLFFIFDHLSTYLADPLSALAIWQGGIAVYGGFLGGLAGGLLAARRARLPVWPLLDAVAPAMLVGQVIGRLGCLSNGDAWGAPCSGPFGICVVYSNPGDLLPPELLGVPTHAYPIYEMAAVGVLLLGLWLARRQLAASAPGTTFLLAALGYSVIRFGLTAFRQETVLFWGLQEAQVVALVTGAVAVALLYLRSRHPQESRPGGEIGSMPVGAHG
jgi:phosphatidylglycerol:prolipoprotein diacylglycerol transferase